MQHDETKLPKWAQKRLAGARRKAQYLTITAARSIKLPSSVTFMVKLALIDGHLISGDVVNLARSEIDEQIITGIGLGSKMITQPSLHPRRTNQRVKKKARAERSLDTIASLCRNRRHAVTIKR